MTASCTCHAHDLSRTLFALRTFGVSTWNVREIDHELREVTWTPTGEPRPLPSKRAPVVRLCERCTKAFSTTHATKVYCGMYCKRQAWITENRDRVEASVRRQSVQRKVYGRRAAA